MKANSLSDTECNKKLAEIKKTFLGSLKADPVQANPAEVLKEGEVLTEREKSHFDDGCYLRHLRARQWDILKTLAMLREYLRWRRTAKPDMIRCTEIEPHFRSAKNYHNGYSKFGQPIVYMRVRLDTPGDTSGKIMSILYQMERSVYLATHPPGAKKTKSKSTDETEETNSTPGVTTATSPTKSPTSNSLLVTPINEQFVWVIDCKDFSRKNIDMSITKEMAKTLDHYCERMGVVFLVGTPAVFKIFWNVAKTFLDEKTASKVVFVNKPGAKYYATWIDEQVLEKDFGGKSEYKYDHPSYFDNVMKIENKIRRKDSKKFGIEYKPVTWEEVEEKNGLRSGLLTPRNIRGTEEERRLERQVEDEIDEEERQEKKEGKKEDKKEVKDKK